MRLIKLLLVGVIFTFTLNASEKININFKNLKIMDLVKITSKIIDKNILVTTQIKGNVDFISNKPLQKDELVKILIYVLESKGYTLVQNNEILRIVKLNEGAKKNVPVLNGSKQKTHYQMVTEVFTVYNANVDYVASKIRHLISKNAKLVTNKESNSLVLTDFLDNIKTVKKVVSIMTNGAKKDTKIVELKKIQAIEAKKNLDAIAKSKFDSKIQTQKVDIIANKDNNSLILIGHKQNINYLAKYVKSVDENDSLVKRVVEVIPLKNVEAKNVIKIIDGVIGKKKYIDQNDKPLSSIDEESNAIVLMGPSTEIVYIKELLKELDKDKPQVYVLAKIIEVSENKTKNIGLKYGFGAGVSNSGGIFSIASSLGGNILPLTQLTDGLKFSQELTRGLALGATLNLLKENQAIDIVSEPSILCINNKESSIYVGETRSFQTGTTTGETTTTNFKREDVGLTLKVKPRISNENKVTLEIETILEDAKEIKNENQTNPDTTKKEVKTSAIVTNGEAVIIGGLIKNKSDITDNDIPFLSDIPILGNLFKNKRRVNDKINLVVIITPYIIPKSKDLTYIRNQLSRLSQLEVRYTKELEFRLKERKLEKEKEDLHRRKKERELEEKRKEYLEEKTEFESSTSTEKEEIDNRTAHEKRVAEILGN
ncbi:secretin N-terminal domain-containing protein [Arcobacter sp. YIC-310]|uniref:secretin N-terminal domain-containing protein n=1 Tax=Arcobacter sp. YIC-310 TaxID=3376632 RepID=UPI003C214D92